MSFIKKYSYLRAIIIGLPFGILCLIYGVRLFRTIPKNDNDLIKITGIVEKVGIEKIHRDNRNFVLYMIQLKNKEKYYSEYIDKLEYIFEQEDKKNVSIIIWTTEDNEFIEQLVVNDELIIEYSPPFLIAHIFFWLGLVTILSALIYIIKHPEELTGKKNK